jgi:hypothetical protein
MYSLAILEPDRQIQAERIQEAELALRERLRQLEVAADPECSEIRAIRGALAMLRLSSTRRRFRQHAASPAQTDNSQRVGKNLTPRDRQRETD